MKQRGLTLVEILVTLVIIALVAGIVGVNVFAQLTPAKERVARAQIGEFKQVLEIYRMEHQRYPTTEEGLRILVEGRRLLEDIPNDPWEREFMYRSPGIRHPKGYDVFSAGEDGIIGNDDDVGNWR